MGTGWGWSGLLAVLTSVGFGVLSAIVPVANAELYVVASQVSRAAGAVPVAVGVGIGQTIGKCVLFLGARNGRQYAARHRAPAAEAQPRGPIRRRCVAVVEALLRLVGDPRWGLPVTFLAAVVGLPPLYAVALLAGATRMQLGWFALVVLVGRLIRFVLVALGVGQLFAMWR